MKHRSLLLLAVVLMGVSLLAGCSKDDDNPASGNTSRAELLRSKTWELKAAESYGVDVKPVVEPYMNKLKFNSDGTVDIDGKSGASVESRWELASGDTKIVLDKNTEDEIEVSIISLSESEFKAGIEFEDEGVVYPTTLTFR